MKLPMVVVSTILVFFLTHEVKGQGNICAVKVTNSCEQEFGDRSEYHTTGLNCYNTPCVNEDYCVIGEPLVLYLAIPEADWSASGDDFLRPSPGGNDSRLYSQFVQFCYKREVCNYDCHFIPEVGDVCSLMSNTFVGLRRANADLGVCPPSGPVDERRSGGM